MFKEDTMGEVATAVKQGNAKAFTDGSYVENSNKGTVVWTITNAFFQNIKKVGTLVPGTKETLSQF